MTKNPWLLRAGIAGIAGTVLLIVGRWWLHQRTTSNPTTGGQMVVSLLLAALVVTVIVGVLRRLGTRLALTSSAEVPTRRGLTS